MTENRANPSHSTAAPSSTAVPTRWQLTSLGLISASILAFEVTLTRVIAINQWTHLSALVIAVALMGFGIAYEPGGVLWSGLLRIVQTPGILVSDYAQIGGLGAAMVNAGLVEACLCGENALSNNRCF